MFILRSAAAAAKSKKDSTINAEDYALNTIVDDESTSEEDVTNPNLDADANANANANANEETNAEADDVDEDEDAANEDDSNKNESLEMEEESEESDGSEEAEVESESEASEGESEDVAAEAETVEAEAESETESAEDKESDEGPQEEVETVTVPPQDSPESNVEEEAEGEGEDSNDESSGEGSGEDSDAASAEAEAISIATKAADENYQPSQSNLASSSPYPLIRSVDGIALKTYNTEPSRFSAKDVVIPLRGNLNVPIHVTTSGSIVDYTVECKDFDVGFGVIAEREEGVTVVKVCVEVCILYWIIFLFASNCVCTCT